jgi:hypothetical protein
MFFNDLIYMSVYALKNLLCRGDWFFKTLIHIRGRKVCKTASGEIPKNTFDLDERYGYYNTDFCIY